MKIFVGEVLAYERSKPLTWLWFPCSTGAFWKFNWKQLRRQEKLFSDIRNKRAYNPANPISPSRNDEHLWCSGSIVSLQTTHKGAIPVRYKSYSIDRNFALIFVTKENTTLLFLFLHDGIEEHRLCSGSIVAFQAIDMGSIPVRCRSYNIDRKVAVIFVTKEFTTLVFSFFLIVVERRRWCSGSIVAFQAIDMGSIPVRCRSYNIDRKVAVIFVTKEFTTLVFSFFLIVVERRRWCSGSIVAFPAIDLGSTPVRCRRYNIDGNFAVLFVTKEYKTLMFSFSSVGIEEHHWCSGSTAPLQAIDMVLIPAWRRRPSLIRIFQENLASEGFKSKLFSTVQVWVDEQRWCSGRIITFQGIEKGSIPVRCENVRLSKVFPSSFDTDELSIPRFSSFHVRVAKHRWWSGSIVAFQTFGMGSILVRGRTYNVDRNFPEIPVTQEFRSLLFSSVHIGMEEHRWGSGSLVALEAIDVCSIPVRWRSSNIDGNFAVLFITKYYTTLMSSLFGVGIEEHHWCSGSTAHLQASDMVLIPAWRRRPSLIRIFQENKHFFRRV